MAKNRVVTIRPISPYHSSRPCPLGAPAHSLGSPERMYADPDDRDVGHGWSSAIEAAGAKAYVR
jgi:hypothetical protein